MRTLGCSWYLVDEWGRRFILLSGSVVMALSLTFMGWFLYLDTTYTPLAVVGCVLIYNALVHHFTFFLILKNHSGLIKHDHRRN
jgi:hypothetical protein